MKQLKSSLLLLLAPALLAACAADEQTPAPGEGGPRTLTFTAAAPQTRTVLQPGQDGNHPVYWSDGDAIAVFPCFPGGGLGNKSTFITRISGGGTAPTAVFTGKVNDLNAERFAAFYPDEAGNLNPANSLEILFSIPAEQAATPGSFAPRTNPAYAPPVAVGGNLAFRNLGALVKLSPTGVDDLKEVTLRVKGDKKWLSGQALFDAENNKIKFAVENGYTAYNWAALKGTLEPGQDYYLVVHPFTLAASDQLSLTFVKADGTRTTKTVTPGRELKLEAGRIANLGDIDLSGAAFERIIDNLELIAAVEQNKFMSWEKNEDGTVTVDKGNNRKEIEWVSSLTNLGEYHVTNLSGIEYFTKLRSLDLAVSKVPFVDVSMLNQLQYLEAQGSQLASLTLGDLPQLETLWCEACNLTSLDIRGLDKLTTLQCGGQQTRTLTLTLTPEQKQKWDASWSTNPTNSGVTVVVKGKGE